MSRRTLAAALSFALFATPLLAAETTPLNPQAPQTWIVQTCDDVTGTGSLRYIAAHAQSGDTIDFGQLPTICGMRDSTITLTAGEVVLHQASILLIGPPPGSGTVTLSGAGSSRVLMHQGYAPYLGTLAVENLRIIDGYAHGSGETDGGCILSDASVVVVDSSVSACIVKSDAGNASGGGISARNAKITLAHSSISGNTALVDANASAQGGATASSTLEAKYCEIDGNRAIGGTLGIGEGGATWSGGVKISYSTFARNSADAWGGGVYVDSNFDSSIRNTTFSENHANSGGGAIFARPQTLSIYNSTIANNAIDGGHGGGVYVSATSIQIDSTIVSGNTSTPMADDADLYLKNGTLTGAANAIMSSNVQPAGFIAITEDPQLAALAWIGGPTRVRAPLPGSPVLGLGNNVSNLPNDQRGSAFPRATGPMTTVDIGAVQFDDHIFVSNFDDFFF